MGNQNVGTPRFYINVLEWLHVSEVKQYDSLFHTLPVTPITPASQEMLNEPYFQQNLLNEQSFQMLLGHNLNSSSSKLTFEYLDAQNFTNHGNYVNSYYDGDDVPDYNGWSLVTCDCGGTDNWRVFWTGSGVMEVGSIVIGTYFDMKNAPNLSLTMSREYGGTKETTTYNGGSVSNTMWSKPPMWGWLGAWEISPDWGEGTDTKQKLSHSGRRTWQLSFSYMDSSDLWGSNQMLTRISPNTDQQNIDIGYESDDVLGYDNDGLVDPESDESKGFYSNLLTDDNFFSQVWHKTLGGTLPFIFQPDGGGGVEGAGNFNPDQFAICKFKDNSLKATQTSPNLYDISLTIEEVW